jgi:hypothetical protein
MDGDLGRQGPALIAVLEPADEILNYLSSEFAMTLRAAVKQVPRAADPGEPPAPRPSGIRNVRVRSSPRRAFEMPDFDVAGEYLVAGYARAHTARDGLSTCRGPASRTREEIYFRAADFFGGGADFFRRAPFAVGGLRASLTALPA